MRRFWKIQNRKAADGLMCREPLLAALSLVLTAVSVWRYLTIRSIFGTFAGLSEQSVSVIGGADGPTSIFVAGKVSQPLGLYAVTACLILVTVFYFVKKYRK